MGCWLATDCTMCGFLLVAWSIWANHVHHCWLAFADGPSDPSWASVLSVPYHATSMIPLAPPATHGISWTADGERHPAAVHNGGEEVPGVLVDHDRRVRRAVRRGGRDLAGRVALVPVGRRRAGGVVDARAAVDTLVAVLHVDQRTVALVRRER